MTLVGLLGVDEVNTNEIRITTTSMHRMNPIRLAIETRKTGAGMINDSARPFCRRVCCIDSSVSLSIRDDMTRVSVGQC